MRGSWLPPWRIREADGAQVMSTQMAEDFAPPSASLAPPAWTGNPATAAVIEDLTVERDAAVKECIQLAEEKRRLRLELAVRTGERDDARENNRDLAARLAKMETQLAEVGRAHQLSRATVDRLSSQNASLRARSEALQFAPSSVSAQDRRNALILSDALALSEGRRRDDAPLAEEKRAEELLAAVRRTVAEVLGVDLGVAT